MRLVIKLAVANTKEAIDNFATMNILIIQQNFNNMKEQYPLQNINRILKLILWAIIYL